MMQAPPILAALGKHKAGVVLIGLQIALTLAIVCNAVFIIGQRIERVNRPTGINEANLVLVRQQFVGAPGGADAASVDALDSLLRQDLAVLRRIPGVLSVSPTNTLPLAGSSWNTAISTHPEIAFQDSASFEMTTLFFMGAQGLPTLGITLQAGRNFRPEEIRHDAFRSEVRPAVVIISRALADALFADGHALGQTVYLNGYSTPTKVIGVVARLQSSASGAWARRFTWHSVVVPKRMDASFTHYAIRTQPGQLAAVMAAVRPALYEANPMRVLDDDSVRSFAEIRASTYEADIGMAILMGIISLILIAVTGAGIVGLTSFWVGQRRKQIGVRRALGARKRDIARYFQLENLLIAGGGALLGIVLAVGLNLLLMQHLAMPRLPISVVLVGVVLVLLLGQAAVFVPARRAAAVPPVVATRSV